MQLAWRWPAPAVTPSALPKAAFVNSAAESWRVSALAGWPDWPVVVAWAIWLWMSLPDRLPWTPAAGVAVVPWQL